MVRPGVRHRSEIIKVFTGPDVHAAGIQPGIAIIIKLPGQRLEGVVSGVDARGHVLKVKIIVGGINKLGVLRNVAIQAG